MNRATRRAIERVYAAVPEAGCKGLCQAACGPIAVDADDPLVDDQLRPALPAMAHVEWERIVERLGHVPRLRTAELQCPLLADGRCSLYDLRPLVCRAYASAEGLECEHGCGPKRRLSRGDVERLHARLLALSS